MVGGKPFKLSLTLHHALFDDLKHFQRPSVCVKYGDEERFKETEFADWDSEKSAWAWRETLTVEVSPYNDITVSIQSTAKYDLWLASLSLTSTRVGEVTFQVASVLPRLRMEDRDLEGMAYSTAPIPFTVSESGRSVGRIFISFETKTAPPSLRKESAEGWCAIGGAPIVQAAPTDDPPYSCRSWGEDEDDELPPNSCRGPAALNHAAV